MGITWLVQYTISFMSIGCLFILSTLELMKECEMAKNTMSVRADLKPEIIRGLGMITYYLYFPNY